MFALTLNPGFILIIAAFLVLAAPRGLGPATIAGAALAGLWLLLDREFGAAAAMAQMGLPVVLLSLDALNRVFGIAMLIALIVIAPYSGARRNRVEDAAILMLAGGSVSALFVGDLLSFVAVTSLAGLSAAWTVFMSSREGANAAGVRMLMWQGLEGLLFLIGVAFQLAEGGGRSVLSHLDIASIGGGFIFAALMIRVGAPLAHVWFKDAVAHASPIGAAANSVFTTMLGVYALARFFPAESILVPIGAAMIVLGAFYAAAEDDLRRAAAYALMTQTGISVTLIGVGSTLALAAAEGQAFATIVAFLALQLALGSVLEREGHTQASGLSGLVRSMPITVAMMLIAGLGVSSAPGFALYVAHSVALDATAQWDLRIVWTLVAASSAALFIALAVKPALVVFASPVKKQPRVHEAPFSMLLGTVLAVFFCIAIGMAPGWLYNLMPTEITFEPYAPDRVVQQLELMAAAGASYILLRVIRAAPRAELAHLLDVDALYRGPLASAGRWLGVVMLRVYGAGRALASDLLRQAASALSARMSTLDRPFADGLSPTIQWLAITGLILIAILFR